MRVPSVEEIIEVQVFGRRVIESARLLAPSIDLSGPKQFAAAVFEGDSKVFARALEGLLEDGADIKDPLQLLYILKNAGPVAF